MRVGKSVSQFTDFFHFISNQNRDVFHQIECHVINLLPSYPGPPSWHNRMAEEPPPANHLKTSKNNYSSVSGFIVRSEQELDVD